MIGGQNFNQCDGEDCQDKNYEPQISEKVQVQQARPEQLCQGVQMNVKDYYENQPKQTEVQRQLSKIYEVKKFQNWIKAVQINESSYIIEKILQRKYTKFNILELGCGKGGDLGKWQKVGIGVWFGIDISGSSLEEALNRYKSSNYSFIIHMLQTSADSPMLKVRIPNELYFDMVSIQFVANLLFKCEDSVNRLFENITERLCKNGLVLLTITDADVLLEKMRKLGTKTEDDKWIYSHDHFSMIFDTLEFSGSPYGLKYNFYLEDSVGEKNHHTGKISYVPEYLIELKNFQKKAAEYNLEIVENLNFTEVYQKYRDKHFGLMKKIMNIGSEEWTMKESHWEISHLYRYIILRHTKGPDQTKIKRKNRLQNLPSTLIELEK